MELIFRINLNQRHISEFENSQLSVANPDWASSQFITTHKHILHDDFIKALYNLFDFSNQETRILPLECHEMTLVEMCEYLRENWDLQYSIINFQNYIEQDPQNHH